LSPEAAKKLRPSMTACCSSWVVAGCEAWLTAWLTGSASGLLLPLMGLSSGLLRIGLRIGICSHSPSDAFMIGGPLGSLTQAPSAAVSSLSASDGAK
jgi:hypothetical protein